MRALVCLALLTSAPALAAPLGYDDARQLLSRTGFGPTDAEVRALAGLDRATAVDRLLAAVRTEAVTPPPADIGTVLEAGKDAPPAVRHAVEAERRDQMLELSSWWYREMLTTPSPLTERMTLFWHSHFVSSLQKVRTASLMYEQNVLLRRRALGNFRTLLHEIAHDPAMLVYLDGVANKQGAPNENFARELMELFTLGEGHYSEKDVKEAARAFTGWSVDRAVGAFRFRPRLHDEGEKTVLGLTGNLDGDAVLDRLLEQPSCAPFVVRKLWRAFVSPTPDEAQVVRLARLLRDGNWELAPVVRALLVSDALYAKGNRGTLVKSPVELIVGTLRQLGPPLRPSGAASRLADDSPEVPPADLQAAVTTGAQLGEAIFAPPNVKGWPGGDAYIDASRLLLRKQFLVRMAREPEAAMTPRSADSTVDLGAFVATLPGDEAAKVKRAEALLLPLPPVTPLSGAPVVALRQLLLDPVYQLK